MTSVKKLNVSPINDNSVDQNLELNFEGTNLSVPCVNYFFDISPGRIPKQNYIDGDVSKVAGNLILR